MKFSMIFEGVNRASKVMKQIMADEKKLAGISKTGSAKAVKANQKVERSVSKVDGAMRGLGHSSSQAWNATTRGAQKAQRATTNYFRNLKAKSIAGFGQLKKGAGRVARGALVATGVMASLYGGAALAAGSMTDVASEFERYETILISSTGSQEKARKAMGWVTNFAATTPYELNQVTEGFVALKNYGIDPTNGTLRTLGDTAAAMGKPMMQAVEAMADAVTGENERLKEFGITASKAGDKITYAYTNAAGKAMEATVKASDRVAIQMKLMEIFNEKYGGSMDRLSKTWSGMMSNMSDMWMKFQLAIMNAGLFDWMKGKLQLALDTINKMEADGSLEAWAKTISQSIQSALESAWAFGVRVYEIMKTVSGYLQVASEYVGGWENLAMILGAMAFGPTLISTAVGIIQIANGLRLLGLALFANPIGLAIAAIAAGAYLIYQHWDAVEPYFTALWEGIKTAFSTVWDFFKTAFNWSPIGIIVNNWSTISQTLTSPIETAKNAIDVAWSAIKLMFNWSPVGVLINNWSKISATLTSPIDTAKAAIGLAWDGIKLLFEWHPLTILARNWNKIASTLSGFVSSAVEKVTAIWDKIKAIFNWSPLEAIERNFGQIGAKISGYISNAAESAGVAWGKLKGLFSSDDPEPIKMALSNPQSIDKAVASTEKLKSGLNAVDAVLDQLSAKIAGMNWHNHGVGLMNTLAAGILAGRNTVVNAVSSVAQSMRDHLPSSPAKVGPLSDIHKLRFAETIAGSIKAGPMVKAMRTATAATMAAAAPVGITSTASANVANSPAVTSPARGGSSGNVQINYSPTIHLSGDAQSAKQDFAKMLDQHRSQIKKLVDEEVRRQSRRQH